jgi:acetyl-CoA carboxylase carboxyl transferase subunit alpha
LIDEIVPEPLGGAHRDPDATGRSLKAALVEALDRIDAVSVDKLLESRYERLMRFGQFSGG